MIIAYDIETCPQPLDSLSEVQTARYAKALARQLAKKPDMDEEAASRLVRSVHPLLCWICCISVCRWHDQKGRPREAVSYAAETPDREAFLLQRFWEDVQKVKGLPTWVTFNGKRFDVPVLRARTLAYADPDRGALRVGRRDLMNTHRYKHKPHADLSCLFEYVSLADVCDLLGVENPKTSMDGSGVSKAVANGRIDEVICYCESDVQATLECYVKAKHSFN